MLDWWNELNLALQIFYAIGIIATVMLILQLLLTLFGLAHADDFADGGVGGDFHMDVDAGLDADGGVDGHVDAGHSSGLQVLSLRSIVAFMAGFGWTGASLLKEGTALWLSILIALAVGLVLMFLIYFMMRMIYSLRASGTVDFANAVGQVGTVYVRIPPAGEGEGQVQVLVQERLSVVPARSTKGEAIPSGGKVRVLRLEAPRTLVVEALQDRPDEPAKQ